MDPMMEAELESGCHPGELEGTFPARLVSNIRRSYEEVVADPEHRVGRIDMDQEALYELQNDEFTTETLQQFFSVTGFLAPYCVVVRKHDGQKGSLMFDHSPRIYYGFQEA